MAPKAEAKAAALDLARSHQEGPRGRPSPRPDLRVSCEPPIPAGFRPTRPTMINGHLPYIYIYIYIYAIHVMSNYISYEISTVNDKHKIT